MEKYSTPAMEVEILEDVVLTSGTAAVPIVECEDCGGDYK